MTARSLTPEEHVRRLRRAAWKWLWIGVLSLFFCGNVCFGCVGPLLAYMAIRAIDAGQIEEAENRVVWARVLTLAGMLIGVAVLAVYGLWALVLSQP